MKRSAQIQRQMQKLWALVILPIINLSALFLADPCHENITHIAYTNQHFPFALIWVITCSLYFWSGTYALIKRLPKQKRWCLIGLTISCIFMIISVCIPYYEPQDALSKLHVNLAMFASVSYILLFFYLLFQYYFYDPIHGAKMISLYTSLIAFLAFLFLLSGSINTWLEVLFVIFMGWIHLYLTSLLAYDTANSQA